MILQRLRIINQRINMNIQRKITTIAFCVILLCIFVSNSNAAEINKSDKVWRCDNADKATVDQLVTRILGFAPAEQRFPENKQEVLSFCNNQYTMIGQLEQYKTQCVVGRRKQVITLAVFSMRNWNNQYCRNGFDSNRLAQKLMLSAKCANSAAIHYRRCYAQFTDQLARVSNGTQLARQIPKMCCSYVRIFECMKSAAESIPVCTESHLEWNENYIRLLFDTITDFICGQYNEVTDKCDKLWQKINLRKNKITLKTVSDSSDIEVKPFFNTLLDILTN